MMPRKEYMTPEQLHEILSYDAGTGELTWKTRGAHLFIDGILGAETNAKRWNKRFSGKIAGSLSSFGYIKVMLPGGRGTPAHRIAWAMYNGRWPTVIDHINGDTQDNRIENLRDVTQFENMKNAKKRSSNKSGVTGVIFDKRENKWRSYINVDNKQISLGYFPDIASAAQSRLAAEKQHGFTARHGV